MTTHTLMDSDENILCSGVFTLFILLFRENTTNWKYILPRFKPIFHVIDAKRELNEDIRLSVCSSLKFVPGLRRPSVEQVMGSGERLVRRWVDAGEDG